MNVVRLVRLFLATATITSAPLVAMQQGENSASQHEAQREESSLLPAAQPLPAMFDSLSRNSSSLIQCGQQPKNASSGDLTSDESGVVCTGERSAQEVQLAHALTLLASLTQQLKEREAADQSQQKRIAELEEKLVTMAATLAALQQELAKFTQQPPTRTRACRAVKKASQ